MLLSTSPRVYIDILAAIILGYAKCIEKCISISDKTTTYIESMFPCSFFSNKFRCFVGLVTMSQKIDQARISTGGEFINPSQNAQPQPPFSQIVENPSSLRPSEDKGNSNKDEEISNDRENSKEKF